jgi:hypothetical protein
MFDVNADRNMSERVGGLIDWGGPLVRHGVAMGPILDIPVQMISSGEHFENEGAT